MLAPYRATPEIHVLPGYFPIPTLGIIPSNAFVIEAEEPVLVDTGLAPLQAEFQEALRSVIDPADLRWLWLAHTDQDHLGSLGWLLDENPDLRVVTTFIGVGKMSLYAPLPLERCYWLNPGESLPVGDRELLAIKPPSFDAPETTGLYDPASGALLTADCLGALMSEPAQEAGDIEPKHLEEGLMLWATIDTPWLHQVDAGSFASTIEGLRALEPEVVLSSHLPAAPGMADELFGMLEQVPACEPWVGPGQPVLAEILAGAGG
ncbi:MAG: MBL fold metallo-hydrolase [Acidimicrobiia bacterium]|nr:MBL fold metallo-hydrolase [Acidimicrobiia bacterium]